MIRYRMYSLWWWKIFNASQMPPFLFWIYCDDRLLIFIQHCQRIIPFLWQLYPQTTLWFTGTVVTLRGRKSSTAIGNVASFQSNHSGFIDGDARRSIPLGERDTSAVVVCLADVVDGQRRRYCVVLDVCPVHTWTSTGRLVHRPAVSVARWISHTLLFPL